jgi:flagellar biosynthesis/type III secretory pathway M-ring protein FliF/YscJ
MNQNVSKLAGQLSEIWKQLGASQRISVLAATFVLVLTLSFRRMLLLTALT